MQINSENCKMLNETKRLIRNRPRHVTYSKISEATGIPVQFFNNLMSGRLKDPGVTRIEIILEYFQNDKELLSA